MKYICYLQFIPKNSNPRKTNEAKCISFESRETKKKRIIERAYEYVDKNPSTIDSYALRNHWELFNIDIKFNNAPWNGYKDLCDKLTSYPMVKGCKTIDEHIFIIVTPDQEANYANKIENYYAGLNPTIKNDQIVRVTVEPKIQQ